VSAARAPRLDRPLTLERRRETPDGGGGLAVAWVPVATLWAEIRAVSARQGDAGPAAVARVSHRIVIRNLPETSPLRPLAADRLREGATVFHVRGVADEPGGAFASVWAETVEVA
jgi:head-tail adaptor